MSSCNEVGFFQEGAPEPHPSIVTRLVRPKYDERQCPYWFPEKFANDPFPVPNVDATNKAYDGWFVQQEHLFFANGHRACSSASARDRRRADLTWPCHAGDPWREATLAADGTHFHSTPGQPLAISDGFHCSDLSTANANVDSTVLAVQQQALESIAGWLAEWKPSSQ